MNLILSSALAETVEAAAETAAEAVTQPSAGSKLVGIIFILFGLYELVQGIATIVTKKLYGKDNIKAYSKYTEESVKACIAPIGLSNALIGAALIIASLYDVFPLQRNVCWIIGAALAVIAIIILLLLGKKLVKKEAK